MAPPRPRSTGQAGPVPVTLVHACLRDGTGGSPTAVVADTGVLDDEARRRIPALSGASHAVFVGARPEAGGATAVRFFTAEGELPACGHGTVAALAYLAEQAGTQEHEQTLRSTDGRLIHGRTTRQGALVQAEFDAGPVALREPTTEELGLLLPALGLPLVATARIATLGRPRLLARVQSRASLEALAPDLRALEQACHDLDLLGCYTYAAPTFPGQRYAARMFAPAIGVPEDIANANSTACLAAHLHASGTLGGGSPEAGRPVTGPAVDMGDSLGSPATITTSVTPGRGSSPVVRVGGTALVTGVGTSTLRRG
ncbi:PhzF family phenazine biosynthesis protein [Streptacidiphilus pinicola]|uniref:PhzF family phenazine biosynthesis protein n=1 Tax=Streptacidiphilus pinicola TaxID=2219663 RepID=A0A2X0INX5_9ACTN|nr:PhzF family phenazine biosynthesis protein [Streptacidiphilus pinicola]RAG86922.1 PhzF family phenazine biosynthesis protein [Streptacidiphilus pinicola]